MVYQFQVIDNLHASPPISIPVAEEAAAAAVGLPEVAPEAEVAIIIELVPISMVAKMSIIQLLGRLEVGVQLFLKDVQLWKACEVTAQQCEHFTK